MVLVVSPIEDTRYRRYDNEGIFYELLWPQHRPRPAQTHRGVDLLSHGLCQSDLSNGVLDTIVQDPATWCQFK